MIDRYIIDTNVVLQYPEVLARTTGKKLVIPEAVLAELQHMQVRGVKRGVQEVIANAIRKGIHISPSQAANMQEISALDKGEQRLSDADLAIVSLAIDYAKRMGPTSVCVVTADRAITDFLSSRGIRSITGSQFLAEPSLGNADKETEASAKSIVSKQRRYLVVSFILGICAALLGNFAFSKLQYLISTFSVWGTLVAIPMLGIMLFWFREHFRLSYGIFEFIIGVIMTYYVLFPNFDYSKLSAVETIQILGGLYVIVRGLDNIGKGVEGTRLEPIWKILF